jgi:hypothetical protein
MSEFPILGGMSLEISVCAERLKGARPTVDCPWALPGAAEIDKRKGQVEPGGLGGRSACTQADPPVGRGIVSWRDILETWRPTAGLTRWTQRSSERQGRHLPPELRELRYRVDALLRVWNFRRQGPVRGRQSSRDK